MKFAICNELFEGWQFDRIAQFVAKVGYSGLELAPFTIAATVDQISPVKRHELKRIAADHNLEIIGLHWLLVKPEGLHINHPDQTVRCRTIEYLNKLIEFCGEIGGSRMIFGSPNQRKVLPELSYQEAWDLAVESFAACAETAKAAGVTICLEALPVAQTNFLNTNAEVLQMVQAINHPNIRMMVDVKSMCADQTPIPDNIRACRGYFRHVHANDQNMRGPGFGEVDFKPIFAALKEVGYDDYISVEVFDFKPDPETIALQSLKYMKECLTQIGHSF